MQLLLLNQNWFAEELREAGHEVVSVGVSAHLDIAIDSPIITFSALLERMPKFKPEAVIWFDNSAPNMFTGLEDCDVPLVFYSVDTHHHLESHLNLSPMFDSIYVAQKDYLGSFAEAGVQASWMPLWASRYVEPSDDKRYTSVFIGNLNPNLNPDRCAFFEALKTKVDMHVAIGNYWEFFPHSEVVVNQTVKGDLNFRVFESMMCGAALLTERSNNGLFDLFRDGEHLVTYQKGNVDECAAQINALIHDRQRCRAIAESGRTEIMRSHLPKHRAELVMQNIRGLRREKKRGRYMGAMANFNNLALSLEKYDKAFMAMALVASMRAAEQALEACEDLRDYHAVHFVVMTTKVDRYLTPGAGAQMLARFAYMYPDHQLILLATIRSLLNRGERAEASKLAVQLTEAGIEDPFATAEDVITQVLAAAER